MSEFTSVDDVPSIVSSLRNTFNADHTRSKGWRLSQLHALQRMLAQESGALQQASLMDLGKSKFETDLMDIKPVVRDVEEAIRNLDTWMAGESVGTDALNMPARSRVMKDPLGVVFVVSAWNYNIPLSFGPLIGAICAGNAVVLKPGDYSINLCATIARLVGQYLDQSAIRCVTGGPDVTTALLRERFDMIFFTGSTRIGKIVAAAAAKNLTPTVLELGGKSPCIVDKSCNVNVCAKRMIWGAMTNAGQTCVRPDYIMVDDQIADQFINVMIQTLREFFGKDMQKSPWFSRLVNQAAFERVSGMVDADRENVIFGGKTDASECYIEPTLIDFGSDWEKFGNSAIMQDEIFGPILPIVRYTDLDQQVIPFIRAGSKPLALYIMTEDAKVSKNVMERTSSGGVAVNDVIMQLNNPHLPFGGVGDSGMGNYHGKHSFDAFSHHKGVLSRSTMLDPPQRYPPFTDANQTFLNFVQHPTFVRCAGTVVDVVTDPKRVLMWAMSAYIAHDIIKSRL